MPPPRLSLQPRNLSSELLLPSKLLSLLSNLPTLGHSKECELRHVLFSSIRGLSVVYFSDTATSADAPAEVAPAPEENKIEDKKDEAKDASNIPFPIRFAD